MKQKFLAEIKRHEGIDGAYVEIPFDVEAVFGGKRIKVKAFFDGKEYRGSIVRMAGCYLIGLTQAHYNSLLMHQSILKSFPFLIRKIMFSGSWPRKKLKRDRLEYRKLSYCSWKVRN